MPAAVGITPVLLLEAVGHILHYVGVKALKKKKKLSESGRVTTMKCITKSVRPVTHLSLLSGLASSVRFMYGAEKLACSSRNVINLWTLKILGPDHTTKKTNTDVLLLTVHTTKTYSGCIFACAFFVSVLPQGFPGEGG